MNQLIEFLKENQLLATLIGVSGAGMLTFWVKDVPRTIFQFLIEKFSTKLIINNNTPLYYGLLRWIKSNYSKKNFRVFKVVVDKYCYSDDDTGILSIGFGNHCIRYNKRFLRFHMVKDSSNQTPYDKEFIEITKFGRSRKLFDELINEVDVFITKCDDRNEIYSFQHGEWIYKRKYMKRDFKSIFIEKDKLSILMNRLNNFIDREKWFVDNGIPYQFGVLLYGPPGTGKTSIIRALASHFNYPIYYVSVNKVTELENSVSKLPDKCFMIIEDIDGNSLVHSRDKKDTSESEKHLESISSILNSLDGLFSSHGRILFATTNHIEKLDHALLRPGRFDMKIEIGYVNNEILSQFIAKFFPDKNNDLSDLIIKDKITVAILQEYVLRGHTYEEISVKKSLDLNKINQKCSLDKSISSELALSDVTPINWSKDVMNGKKKVVIDN